MKRRTQCEMVLAWLERGDDIDPMTALDRLGISRLSPRIGELEKQGHEIRHSMKRVLNGAGEVTRIASYRLVSRAPAAVAG